MCSAGAVMCGEWTTLMAVRSVRTDSQENSGKRVVS